VKVVYLNTQSKTPQHAQSDGALYDLISEHEGALRRFIRVRARASNAEVEDILQEMYTKLFSMEGLVEKTEQRQDTFKGFLFTDVTT